MGMPERMRDMISGVLPDSVRLTIAFTPLKWLAAYMEASAMVSSQRLNDDPTRWCDMVVMGSCSAPWAMRAIAATASTGYWPDAVSPDSITASVQSSTALATSETSARVGRGLAIIDSIICVAVLT